MGFVKDFDKLPTGMQRRIDAAKNVPVKKTVLPPDFPTLDPGQPIAPKHVEKAPEIEEVTEPGSSSGTKVSVTIRMDEETVAFFKGTGKGWQTRINAILVQHVRAAQKA